MKAVLVLNKMPENCGACRFYQNYRCYVDFGVCLTITKPGHRLPRCPLKPISDEMLKACEQKCDWDLYLDELKGEIISKGR